MNQKPSREGATPSAGQGGSVPHEFPSRSSRRRAARGSHRRTHSSAPAAAGGSVPEPPAPEKSVPPKARRRGAGRSFKRSNTAAKSETLKPRKSLRTRASSLSRPALRPTQAASRKTSPRWYSTMDPRVASLDQSQKGRIHNPRLSMRDYDDAHDATSPSTTLTHLPAIKPVTGSTPIVGKSAARSASGAQTTPPGPTGSQSAASPAKGNPARGSQGEAAPIASAHVPARADTSTAALASAPAEETAHKNAREANLEETESGSSSELKRQESRWWLGAAIVICLLALIAGAIFGFFKLQRPDTESQMLPSDKKTSASPTASPTPSTEPSPVPTVRTTEVPSGLKGSYDAPTATGRLIAIPGQKPAPEGEGKQVAYNLSYEEGMPIDSAAFAESVHNTLNDSRSWPAQGMRFSRTDYQPQVNLQLVTPGTIKKRCAGTVDDGFASCLVGNTVMLNSDRWFNSADAWHDAGGSADEYRAYLLNYFIGLATGKKAADCPGQGEVANVMQSQTYELGGCKPNGWVDPDATEGR
ncbi:MAG: DUF3152 domain-containing protein [Winkia neuii]|uniref:DUF3152 domain-containing protein n=1 Tax=Winkia neuii TaxID=33007 RepID=UPI00290244AB|nr:DUF3152 domain-containing protein [Winkia neuii]MDU3133942.1 DUF3152 domain-containing protein [Winkia neuii]